jgi:hypothetical protein
MKHKQNKPELHTASWGLEEDWGRLVILLSAFSDWRSEILKPQNI